MTKIIEDTAQHVMDVVPIVMRTLRAKLREQRAADISVPQFRMYGVSLDFLVLLLVSTTLIYIASRVYPNVVV